MKNNKATGIDNIAAEVLKIDIDTTASEMEKLFREIWDAEEVPDEWKQGLIVKLPKKGDLTVCGNWRSLTLMSVPAKCLGRCLIRRFGDDIDKMLRREQAGFRPRQVRRSKYSSYATLLSSPLSATLNCIWCSLTMRKPLTLSTEKPSGR